MDVFEFDGVRYWVPHGWDVALFGGVLYRRFRKVSRWGQDRWIVVDFNAGAGV